MNSSSAVVVGWYDYRLVALSVAVAVLAAYASLDLGGRVTNASGGARLAWLNGGALALGIGIWATHYIGVLAFRLPFAMEYDWPTVLPSLLAAVLASEVGLFVVSRQAMTMTVPKLDGIEATVALRGREKVTGGHQPVIALTALTIKGDRQRCLIASMDGYLSKPIRQQEPDELLGSYTSKLSSTKVDTENPAIAEPTSSQGPDSTRSPLPRQAFNATFSLNEAELMDRIGGDLEFLSELTDVFRMEYPKQLRAAHQAVKDNDGEALCRAGHALRGALANLAATDSAALARSIELTGATGVLSAAGPLLHKLEQAIKTVIASLESLCKEFA